MDNAEIIAKIKKYEHYINLLPFEIAVALNDKVKNELVSKLEISNIEFDKLKVLLEESTNYTWGYEKINDIIRQINHYIGALEMIPNGLNPLRNQGYLINNYLFSQILIDLKMCLEHTGFSIINISSLLYSNNADETIDTGVLVEFLRSEIQVIKSIENPNYFSIKEYLSGFVDKMHVKFNTVSN